MIKLFKLNNIALFLLLAAVGAMLTGHGIVATLLLVKSAILYVFGGAFSEKNFNNNYREYRVVRTAALSVDGKELKNTESYHIEYPATRFGYTFWKKFYKEDCGYGDCYKSPVRGKRADVLSAYHTFAVKYVTKAESAQRVTINVGGLNVRLEPLDKVLEYKRAYGRDKDHEDLSQM